jgi:hypothetical protein
MLWQKQTQKPSIDNVREMCEVLEVKKERREMGKG